MRDSRAGTVFGLMLIMAFTMPMMCFALATATSATADSGAMPGGCHGHHGSMPPPAHACCYVVHQVPMSTPATLPQIALNDIGGWVSTSADSEPQARIAIAIVVSDFSPPLPAVLRI